MTSMPPRLSSTTEELWIHKSDGSRARAEIDWLKRYLLNNPGLLSEIGYVPKQNIVKDPTPLIVYKPPPNAQPPIPFGIPGKVPAWSTAPVNPDAGKPMPVVAGQLCVISNRRKKAKK